MEVRPGQAKRADVRRPGPGSTEQRRPDDELGRSAADVDDRDDLRQCLAGTGDGAVVGEASFAVGGEHANRQAGRLGEGVRQRRRRASLATGRCDDHDRAVRAELLGGVHVRAANVRAHRDRPLAEGSGPLDLGPEPEIAALLRESDHGAVDLDGGDQEAGRVGAHIDHCDAHPYDCGGDTGHGRRTYLRERPSVWRRARAWARRIIAAWWSTGFPGFAGSNRVQAPSLPSLQA